MRTRGALRRCQAMKFEETILDAIRIRAQISGERYMPVQVIYCDLGAPVDFEDGLQGLHDKGLINFHRFSEALTLTERGCRLGPRDLPN